MVLDVLGVGWCRTGTSSLQVALNELGLGPCFHGRFLPYLRPILDNTYLYSLGQIEAFPVDELFGHYRAAVDIPPGLTPLLLKQYPSAKVILTVRDPEKWWSSVEKVIIRLYRFLLVPFFWHTQLGRRYTAIIKWNLDTMFHGDLSKDNCIHAYEDYNMRMQTQIPANQLLLWQPQHGWEPLCRFLGVAVPDKPFPPPQNEGMREMLMQMIKYIRRNPLASVGMKVYNYEGALDFEKL